MLRGMQVSRHSDGGVRHGSTTSCLAGDGTVGIGKEFVNNSLDLVSVASAAVEEEALIATLCVVRQVGGAEAHRSPQPQLLADPCTCNVDRSWVCVQVITRQRERERERERERKREREGKLTNKVTIEKQLALAQLFHFTSVLGFHFVHVGDECVKQAMHLAALGKRLWWSRIPERSVATAPATMMLSPSRRLMHGLVGEWASLRGNSSCERMHCRKIVRMKMNVASTGLGRVVLGNIVHFVTQPLERLLQHLFIMHKQEEVQQIIFKRMKRDTIVRRQVADTHDGDRARASTACTKPEHQSCHSQQTVARQSQTQTAQSHAALRSECQPRTCHAPTCPVHHVDVGRRQSVFVATASTSRQCARQSREVCQNRRLSCTKKKVEREEK